MRTAWKLFQMEKIQDLQKSQMPEEETEQKTEQKTEASGRQFLMIILTLLAVCIMAFAAIFVFCKKRR